MSVRMVATHLQLHFGVCGAIKHHRDRCRLLTYKATRVERRFDRRSFVSLQCLLANRWRGTSTARANSGNVHIFFINIAEVEVEDTLGTTPHTAKIMTLRFEHLLSPTLG